MVKNSSWQDPHFGRWSLYGQPLSFQKEQAVDQTLYDTKDKPDWLHETKSSKDSWRPLLSNVLQASAASSVASKESMPIHLVKDRGTYSKEHDDSEF